MPITLNGFLPDENEKLMEWLRTDRNGFPYWENRARAYEDLAALLLILELLCLVYPVIFAAGKIHWLWKHKTEIRQKLVQWIKVFVKELRIWMKHVKAQERPVKKQ